MHGICLVQKSAIFAGCLSIKCHGIICEILCLTVNANRLTGHTSHLVENIRFKHVIELQD